MSEPTWTGREVMSVMVEHPDKIYCTTDFTRFAKWDNERNQFIISLYVNRIRQGEDVPAFTWEAWALDATWREWKSEAEEREPVLGAIYTGTKVKSLMDSHPGLKFEIVHSKDGERLVVWKDQYRGWGYAKYCNDGYRRCGGKIEWPDSWDNAVWRLVDDKQPEPEPEPEDRIYTGAEAFHLMGKTPGRAFTPVDTKIPEFRVFCANDRYRLCSAWRDSDMVVFEEYDIHPASLIKQWREYFPKPKSKPTTGLSIDEAVARVRSGEANTAVRESALLILAKKDIDACDWEVDE